VSGPATLKEVRDGGATQRVRPIRHRSEDLTAQRDGLTVLSLAVNEVDL
jgi:hypothetical protein